jgi:hypothetical protein
MWAKRGSEPKASGSAGPPSTDSALPLLREVEKDVPQVGLSTGVCADCPQIRSENSALAKKIESSRKFRARTMLVTRDTWLTSYCIIPLNEKQLLHAIQFLTERVDTDPLLRALEKCKKFDYWSDVSSESPKWFIEKFLNILKDI